MSTVNGFQVGSETLKYNYESLENYNTPEFNTSNTYAVGDYVIYQGKLYRCISNVSTAGSWNSSNWTLAVLSDDVRDLKNAIDELDASKAPVIINTASGDIATFDDGADDMPMKALVATIEPVQDLHGFDHPWPAGSGKNLLPTVADTQVGGITFHTNSDGSISANGTATSNDIFGRRQIITIPAGSYKASCSAENSNYRLRIGNADTQALITQPAGNGVNTFTLTEATRCEVAVRIQDMEGSVVNATFYPMITLSTETDNSYAPYSNICPISGWTGLTGKRTGKNLLKYPYALSGSVTHNGVDFTQNNDGSFLVNGTATAYAEKILYSGYASEIGVESFLKPGEYILGGSSGPVRVTLYTYINNAWTIVARSSNGNPVSITINKGIKYGMSVDVATNSTVDSVTVYPMICVDGETDLTWEPYISKDISVNWQSQAGEVYGGTVDVVSGKLVIDKKMISYDGVSSEKKMDYMGSFEGVPVAYSVYNDGFIFGYNVQVSKATAVSKGAKCSVVPYSVLNSVSVFISNPQSYYFRNNAEGQFQIRLYNENLADLSAYNGWLAQMASDGTPVQVVYPLKDPIEYQLTPQEVTTLLGNNVVYTDVGPVSVAASRDTKMYIDNKIAEAVAAALNA